MTVLAIETGGLEGSVCVLASDGTPRERILPAGFVHGRNVIPALRDLLDDEGVALPAVSLIAVDHGPGSHTGLRVGITAAKVLGHLLDRPVRGIDATAALVAQARPDDDDPRAVAVAIDARSNGVFGGVWSPATGWHDAPGLRAARALGEALPPDTIVIGSGRAAVREAAPGPTLDAGEDASHVRARTVARLAAASADEARPAAELAARYFR